jgi:hypothetical protein
LGPDAYPKFFNLAFKFVKLIELKFDSLLHHPVGSQILLLHFAAGSQISPLHDTAGVQPMIFAEIFLLHFATSCSGESNHTAAKCSGE